MIFDGKKFAQEIEEQVKTKIAGMDKKPKIVSVLVGNDPASELYTRLKKSAAERCGIDFWIERLDANSQMLEIQQKMTELAGREDVTGLMVQLPISGLRGDSLKAVLDAIPPNKDVDGLRWRESGVKPATVRAVISILEKLEVADVWSKKFVVLGSRGAVGEPLVYFLRQKGAEVTEVEWDTPNPSGSLLEGDVIISCVGKAELVNGEMIRDGGIVIDVGMSQKDGKIAGDMTPEVCQKAGVAVPVPGGVGPVTIACLIQNATELV
jgi:methylenetetrahydrofolate dehydrogenase (NADP+)/methenyltetrahydrofolate cyclohydrolase